MLPWNRFDPRSLFWTVSEGLCFTMPGKPVEAETCEAGVEKEPDRGDELVKVDADIEQGHVLKENSGHQSSRGTCAPGLEMTQLMRLAEEANKMRLAEEASQSAAHTTRTSGQGYVEAAQGYGAKQLPGTPSEDGNESDDSEVGGSESESAGVVPICVEGAILQLHWNEVSILLVPSHVRGSVTFFCCFSSKAPSEAREYQWRDFRTCFVRTRVVGTYQQWTSIPTWT